MLWTHTVRLCWFSIISVGSENVDVEELRVSNKFKFDVSDLLQGVHRQTALFQQLSKNTKILENV